MLLALAAAVALAAAPVRPLAPAAGISGLLPTGWRVVDRPLTACTDPAEVLALATFRPRPHAALGPRGAFLLLEEFREGARGMPRRPRRFALVGRRHRLTCCEPVEAAGWLIPFAAAGRGFYAYAYVGPRAPGSRRAELLGILDSLRVERPRAVRWRRSLSVGAPWLGALDDGVQLPSWGRDFWTWDPLLHRSPDRAWRRYGNDAMVRKVLRVAQDFAAAHLVRLGIGDLSRPHGGYFGPRHVSHQNGLDVDVYYPRRDRRLRPPDRPADIDRGLSQDLVDAFVRAGATRIFVGPNTGLHGPPAIVQVLAGHDNHVHVRFSAPSDGFLLGRSELGRPIRAWERGDPVSPRRVLVFGCIHGTECAALAITQRLLASEPTGIDLWVVPNANPDGYARGTRVNGRGVDLNRNWPSEWRPHGQAWSDPEYSGARPWSERETRIARDLILRLRPRVTIWFHQPQDVVRAWGPSVPLARRYARLARLPFRRMRWPRGTAPNWQNHRFPESSSFVVELPAGALPAAAAAREARAVLALLP